MHFHTLTLCAFSGLAVALQRRDGTSTTNSVDAEDSSIANVFASIIPRPILDYAATNVAGFQASLSSDLADGSTPAWYPSLPAKLQASLLPAAATTTPSVPVLTTTVTTTSITLSTSPTVTTGPHKVIVTATTPLVVTSGNGTVLAQTGSGATSTSSAAGYAITAAGLSVAGLAGMLGLVLL